MDGKTYPYLDLAALPAVGALLLDARPAFVFAADGSRLLFANAASAAMLDTATMSALLDLRFSDLNPIKAQAARLSRVLPSETTRLEMLRFGQGVSLATLPAACRRLNLPGDGRAVLAVATNAATRESLTSRAERLVDLIAEGDCLAAIVTAEGKVVAASGGYDALAPVEGDIDAMMAAAGAAKNNLLKRRLRIGTHERQAGVAAFTADGRDFFLVMVGPAESAQAAPAKIAAASPPIVETAATEPMDFDAAGGEVDAGFMFPDIEMEDEAAEEPFEDALPPTPVAVVTPEPVAASTPTPQVAHFVFEADAEGRFTLVSPELAAAVGIANGSILGQRWTDLQRSLALGSDAHQAFAGGTLFTVTVAWPTDQGDTVAVTFTGAALLDREKHLTGYRGFGTVKLDERRPDTQADQNATEEGTQPPPEVREPPSPAPQSPEPAEPAVVEAAAPVPDPPVPAVERASPPPPRSPLPQDEAVDPDEAAQWSIEQGAHRLRPSKPSPAAEPAAATAQPSKAAAAPASTNVVRLPSAPSRILSPERLTGTERDAFRRIAEALGTRKAETDEAADAAPAPRETPRTAAAEIDTKLLDRLPVGIVVFRDRKPLFINRTALELLAYENFDAFVAAGGTEAIFPGGSGLAGNIAESGGRLSALRSDGSTMPLKAWLHAVTWAGATALMLSLVPEAGRSEDETTLELARIEARAEELEAILNTATDGVVIIDGRGKIGNMNRAAEALFGVEAGQYLGRYFTDLLADESQKGALDYLDGLAENGVASVLNDGREVIGRVPNGGLIPLFMTMGRIGISDKFCAVLRDITHWKNVEEELTAARRAAETANAQKSEFLAKVSHEIRTPLNAIIGFSEVMMGERFGPVGNERYKTYLHDIHVSGAHLLSLINDLLDLSKIEAGKLDLAFEAVPVNPAIQECVALMQPQANRERIIIRTSLSADVPNVVADQRAFRQILLNLMSNAVKFTRAGGQVIVSSSLEESGEVVVRIRDTGIGMSEKDIETALKPFRQVALAKDDREHGTGLGLPLTKALIEANRASFAIESAPNQGTLVRITFPTTRVLAG